MTLYLTVFYLVASPRASQKSPPEISTGSLPRDSPGQAYNFDIYANRRNPPATAHRTGTLSNYTN